MPLLLHRRGLLRASLAATAALALPQARACEVFISTMRIFHPWTRETDELESTARVCMILDEVNQTDRLIGLETPVAERAELDGLTGSRTLDLLVPEGKVTALKESGTFIRLLGLKHALGLGRSYPLTLHFEKGGSITTSLSVDYTATQAV